MKREILEFQNTPISAKALEWYEKEYEILTKHYEEVWKSGALNFSYAGIVSAALLAFGSNRVQLGPAIAISVLPLILWHFAINRVFGKDVKWLGHRLREIEKAVARSYDTGEGHFTLWHNLYEQEHGKPDRKVPGISRGIFWGFIAWILIVLFAYLLFYDNPSREFVADYLTVPEKPNKVQLTDPDLEQAVRIQVTEIQKNGTQYNDLQKKVDTLIATSEAQEKSTHAIETTTDGLEAEVKTALRAHSSHKLARSKRN